MLKAVPWCVLALIYLVRAHKNSETLGKSGTISVSYNPIVIPVNQTIGFIGGGHMTRNFLGGLVARTEIDAAQISVFDRNPPKNTSLSQDFGVNIASSTLNIVETCDVVVISVKPQSLKETLEPLKKAFNQQQPLLISLAAGTTISSLETQLSDKLSIVRAMPNMASLIGLGATGLLANSQVDQSQRNQAQFLGNSVGISAWVTDDAGIDSITALSGSGPAYFMLFINALAEAASKAGINKQDALRFATQTALGAAKLVEQSDEPIGKLIEAICSKGGTTEQAILQFRNDELEQLVSRAFHAAKRRSQELASESA